AAAAHPIGELFLDVGRQRADVGHGDDAGARIDQFGNGDVDVRFARLANVSEGLHGAGDVVERREQRLGGVGRPAGEEADASLARTMPPAGRRVSRRMTGTVNASALPTGGLTAASSLPVSA